MTLGNRLKQFAENNYPTVVEFSKQLGINRENAYRYFKDVVSPGAELLIRLAEMGCDINWLLTGIKSSTFDNNNYKPEQKKLIPIERVELNELPRVLEYSIMGTIPAGKGELVDLTDWVEKMVIDYSPHNHALLVVDEEFGYSMAPIIQPGDVALFSFDSKIRNGRPVAARWDKTKGALKIAHFNINEPERITLLSSNSAEPPIFVQKSKVQLFSIVAFFLLGRDNK
ncbi:MAG: LexA family transcriptional regulator [bacterium]